MNAILDLDDPKSICSALYSLIDTASVWDVLLADVREKHYIFNELSATEESVTTPMVHHLRADAECIIRSEYASLAVYHACRPLDRSTYATRGIIRTSEVLLRELTRKTFSDTSNVEDVFVPVCKKYLEWYDGTIGLFLTAYEYTSWHKRPCFLGKMADALDARDSKFLNDYLTRSIPTIVKCRLPIDWVDSKMRDPSIGHYASSTLQRMILMRATSRDPTNDLGALGLKADIPPEMIIEFLDPPNE